MGNAKLRSHTEADGALVPLERSLGYHVRQLAETWQAVMDHEGELRGVTVSQWRYLRELWEEDGLTSGELTRRVGRQGPADADRRRADGEAVAPKKEISQRVSRARSRG